MRAVGCEAIGVELLRVSVDDAAAGRVLRARSESPRRVPSDGWLRQRQRRAAVEGHVCASYELARALRSRAANCRTRTRPRGARDATQVTCRDALARCSRRVGVGRDTRAPPRCRNRWHILFRRCREWNGGGARITCGQGEQRCFSGQQSHRWHRHTRHCFLPGLSSTPPH